VILILNLLGSNFKIFFIKHFISQFDVFWEKTFCRGKTNKIKRELNVCNEKMKKKISNIHTLSTPIFQFDYYNWNILPQSFIRIFVSNGNSPEHTTRSFSFKEHRFRKLYLRRAVSILRFIETYPNYFQG
jgi:hypothetical protein